MSDNRIGIHFNVNTAELKRLQSAVSTMRNFESQAKKMEKTMGAVNRAYGNSAKGAGGVVRSQAEMQKMIASADSSIQKQMAGVNAMTTAQGKLQKQIQAYNKQAKVSIDRNGKMTTQFKDTNGNIQKMSHTWDKATQSMKYQGTSMVTSAKDMNKATNGLNQSTKQLGDSRLLANKASQESLQHHAKMHGQMGMIAETQKGLNKYQLSWAEATGIAALRMAQWSLAAGAIYGTARAFKDMIGTIVDVNLQLTEMKQVMDDGTDFENVMRNSIAAATEFGKTVREVNDAMVEFGRQGLDEEQVDRMARATAILANVGQFDMGDAASGLTGVMNIYKKDFTEATQIVDRFNEVANNYAIDAENLVDSIRRSGGSANAFGIELETLIGYTTAITEATRESGSIVGNSLKTIASRVTTVSGSIDALHDAGVGVFDPITSQARPVQDIFDDLAGKWDMLTENQRQNIGVQVAGRHQLSRFLVLMDNYDTATAAASTATNSYGSAVQENETYMESYNAKITQLVARVEEFAIAAGNSGLGAALMVLTDIAINLVSGFTDLVENFNVWTAVIPTVIAGVGLLGSNFKKLWTMSRDTSVSMADFHTALGKTNPHIVTMGTKMGLSTANATLLAGAVGKVTRGLKTMAAATIGNPLFWIPVAISALVGYTGSVREAEKAQESLNKQANESAEEFEDFKEKIKLGTIDEYGYNALEERLKTTKDAMEESKDVISSVKDQHEQNSEMVRANSDAYASFTNASMKDLDVKTEQIEMTAEQMKATKELTDEQKEQLTTIGVFVDENKTMKDVIEEVEGVQRAHERAVEDAKQAMLDAKQLAIDPTAAAYEDLAAAMEDGITNMEILLGFNEDMVEQLAESYNSYLILSEVKGKDSLQTQRQAELEENLANQLGVSVDYLKKNEGAIWDKINAFGESEKAIENVTSTEMTEQERQDAASAISKSNKVMDTIHVNQARQESKEVHEAVTEQEEKLEERRTKASNKFAKALEIDSKDGEKAIGTLMNATYDYTKSYEENMDDVAGASQKKASKLLGNYMEERFGLIDLSYEQDKYQGASAKVFGDVTSKSGSKTKSVMDDYANEKKSTGDAIEKATQYGNNFSTEMDKVSTKSGTKTGNVISDLRSEMGEMDTSNRSWLTWGGTAKGSLDLVSTTSGSTKDQTNSSLGSIIEKLGETTGGWEGLREKFKNPIKGAITMSIKGIFGGLLGAGGDVDGDKLKDKVMSSGGGSIAGGGFGGLTQSSGFGYRKHPITGKMKLHAGMDLAGKHGSAITARQGGIVTYSGQMGGYGNIVMMRGSNGLEYRYAHNSANHVKAGQFVPAGQRIASLGSTGDSTGPHLHFEVRRGGTAINPRNYYHNGGVVDNKPKHNEVDTRLQVGEMVINQGQQKNLFDMLDNKKQPMELGMGGPIHKVQKGETISELAMQYYGNAYSGGMDKLMKLNPSIKNRDRIFAGQNINVPSNGASKAKTTKTKAKPKPTFKNKEAAENYWDKRMDRYNYLSSNDLRGPGFLARSMSAKERKAVGMLGTSEKRDFNSNIIKSVSELSDVNQAKSLFNKNSGFMGSYDKTKAWANVLNDVSNNVLEKANERTSIWLDNFNKKIKDAHRHVTDFLGSFDQMINRKFDEKKDDYIGDYTDSLYKRLNINFGEELTEAEELEKKMAGLQSKIETRAEESASLQFGLDAKQTGKRLTELQDYIDRVNTRMNNTVSGMKSKGVKDSKILNEAREPYQEKIQELKDEYNELNKAMKDSNKQIDTNEKQMKKLSQEYKDLEQQLNNITDKREFTDIWGNVIKDAEQNIKMVTGQVQAVMDAREAVKATTEEMAYIAERMNQSSYDPNVVVQNENVSSNETKTYQADTNVVRDVTYVVQTGVAIASQSELREFAMMLKDMMDEENDRS